MCLGVVLGTVRLSGIDLVLKFFQIANQSKTPMNDFGCHSPNTDNSLTEVIALVIALAIAQSSDHQNRTPIARNLLSIDSIFGSGFNQQETG